MTFFKKGDEVVGTIDGLERNGRCGKKTPSPGQKFVVAKDQFDEFVELVDHPGRWFADRFALLPVQADRVPPPRVTNIPASPPEIRVGDKVTITVQDSSGREPFTVTGEVYQSNGSLRVGTFALDSAPVTSVLLHARPLPMAPGSRVRSGNVEFVLAYALEDGDYYPSWVPVDLTAPVRGGAWSPDEILFDAKDSE